MIDWARGWNGGKVGQNVDVLVSANGSYDDQTGGVDRTRSSGATDRGKLMMSVVTLEMWWCYGLCGPGGALVGYVEVG